MRRVLLAVAAILLLGAGSGTRLLAQAQPPAGLPSLAILPLKEEGRKDLGDLSDTLNMCVATAFGDSGGFRLVEPGKVQAALADLKLPAGPVDPASVPPLGKRLGAQYVLMGSYLPETNLAKGAVTVTVTLRLTDAADGSVVKNILEVGEGSSLGGAVAALVRQLTPKASAAGKAAPVPVPAPAPAPVPAPVPAAVPAPAAVPTPGSAPAPAAPAPAAAPVPVVVPVPAPLPVPAPAPAPKPAAVPEPAPAAVPEPAPRKAPQALLVLREGRVNGVYYEKGSLSRFGVKLEDFKFLLQALAGKLPPGTDVAYDLDTRGAADDFNLNLQLAKEHHPDTLAVLDLDCNSRSVGFLKYKTAVQATVRILLLDPRTLETRASRTVVSDFVPAKGLGEAFPKEVKDQLAARMDLALDELPLP